MKRDTLPHRQKTSSLVRQYKFPLYEHATFPPSQGKLRSEAYNVSSLWMFETATVLTVQNDNSVVAGRDHAQTLALLLRYSPLNMTRTTVVPGRNQVRTHGHRVPELRRVSNIRRPHTKLQSHTAATICNM
jgi:hypothetical protein